ncbi:MAG: alpha/beta fold hydrolase [Alphaproteobacteria bacterium]|nr:alpha/beta fold hydrolase [Alphaproteobacteria bacterium]
MEKLPEPVLPPARHVAANGLSFEVLEAGDGDRLALLLHGFPELNYSWRYQIPLLVSLGYKVAAPNLRGYGGTSRPKGVAAYHIDRLVEDVSALIDHYAPKETVLIAHDWGAIIAWHVAIRKARPLAKLVIMNVPHPACAMRELRTWAQLKKSWYVFFFQIPWLPEWVFRRNGGQAIGQAFSGMAVDKSRFPQSVLAVYRSAAAEPGALTAMINYYRAAMRAGSAVMNPQPGTVETPTLMIWGEEDSALGKETTYGTENYVSDLTLRYLPRVSHWVQQEAPETVNAMLEAWLTGAKVPEAGVPDLP